MSTSGKRHINMAARRNEIVASAARLWRAHGVEKVSIQQIAEGANVSPQTIYNLIGGLDALVFATIEDLLDRLDDTLGASKETGIALSLICVRASAEMFAKDPMLYRQLIVRVPQAIFSGADFARDSATIQIEAVRQAQQTGDVEEWVSPDALGQHIFVGYMGALYAWGCGGLDEPAFLRSAELAAVAPLTAAATATAAPALRDRLQALLPQSLLAGSP